MKNFSVKVLCEIAIFAAIGFVLDILQGGIWKGAFANGGSIGFAMVPIFIISYRRGLVPGLICGLLLSLVQMLGGIYVINGSSMEGWKQTFGPFLQIMLDYVLAYTVVGFAGAFSGAYKKANSFKKQVLFLILGCVLGGMLKYFSHAFAGIFFWPGKMWGITGAMYSWLYNGLYMIPNIIVCTGIMILIAKVYPIFLNPDEHDKDELNTFADNASIEEEE